MKPFRAPRYAALANYPLTEVVDLELDRCRSNPTVEVRRVRRMLSDALRDVELVVAEGVAVRNEAASTS